MLKIKFWIFLFFISHLAFAEIDFEEGHFVTVEQAYDIDDTLLFLLSKIFIFEIGTDRQLSISTRDYAELGEYVGKPIPIPDNLRRLLQRSTRKQLEEISSLEKFVFKASPQESLREFSDFPDYSSFITKLNETLSKVPFSRVAGPRLKELLDGCQTEEDANKRYFVSARGHDPQNIHDGFSILFKYIERMTGKKYFVPPVENMILVTHQLYKHLGSTIEGRKLAALTQILDRVQKEASEKGGAGLVTFADDDFQNFDRVREGLKTQLWRWPNVRIQLDYVGSVHPGQKFLKLILKKQFGGHTQCSSFYGY